MIVKRISWYIRYQAEMTFNLRDYLYISCYCKVKTLCVTSELANLYFLNSLFTCQEIAQFYVNLIAKYILCIQPTLINQNITP